MKADQYHTLSRVIVQLSKGVFRKPASKALARKPQREKIVDRSPSPPPKKPKTYGVMAMGSVEEKKAK